MTWRDLILKHALINAINYGGKADAQAVLGKVLAEDPSLKNKISEVMKELKEIVNEVNSLSIDEIKERVEILGLKIVEKKIENRGLAELPNAEKGKVVLRLAPYPSGPLHIGNARMVVLNDEYAKKYRGKLFLVIDDTIGSEEKFILPEAYKLIVDGLKWLGVKYNKIFYKSDRLEIYYMIAEEMIKKDLAYVCECDAETLRRNRAIGLACKHRGQTVEENLEKWKNMLSGKYKEGSATLRLKTDMQHPDPAFRDRVLLRVVEREHPRVGKKYKVWPMLEFSWAVDDYLLGITHIIRGKDLVMEDLVEEFIWEKLGWDKKVEFIHYGLFNLQGIKLSKTQARKAIEKGKYSGWDDPRTWSLQSLKRRGIQPKAIRNFIINMGLSQADISIPVEILYSENRKLIDSKANRYFAVFDPIEISIPKLKIKRVKALLHPDFPKRGNRIIPINKNKIYIERTDFEKFYKNSVGLINLLTIKVDRNSEIVSKDVKFEFPKVHWVSEPNVKICAIMPDGSVKEGICEPAIKKVKVDDLVQFVRNGFYRVDKVGKEIILYFGHK
jgi:glutamyl-tRNA synthetase